MVGSQTKDNNSPKLVIIDTDPGIDDFMALALAFSQHPHHIRILALTVVFGNNNDILLLSRNARFTLNKCCQQNNDSKETEPRIVFGASQPLQREYKGDSAVSIHGENGLGNHPEVDKFTGQHSLDEHHLQNMDAYNKTYGPDGAPKFIVDMCQRYPEQIHLITLGPLTNVARAIEINPNITSQIASVTIMGGSVSTGGNITPAAEANIYNDPEAVREVFNAGFNNMTLVPIDVTSTVHLKTQQREQLKAKAGTVGDFIYSITDHYVSAVLELGLKNREQMPTHDPTAVVCFLRPDLFNKVACYVDVELQGELTLGATIADWRGKWKKPPNMEIALSASGNPSEVSDYYSNELIKTYGSNN